MVKHGSAKTSWAPRPCDGPQDEEEADLYGNYQHLVPITIEDDLHYLPENNSILRCLQYLEVNQAKVRMAWGKYCWNNTVGCCEMKYRPTPESEVITGRACQVKIQPGLQIIVLPKGGRYVSAS